MNFWAFLTHMFNGNETARAMRYSLTIIVVLIVATYFGIVTQEFSQALILTATGYIFGKAKAHTEVIQPTDRRDGKAITTTDNELSS